MTLQHLATQIVHPIERRQLMSRSRLAVVALVFTAGVAVYGVVTNPEPMCAPAGVASATPPEPVADYRDGADYNC